MADDFRISSATTSALDILKKAFTPEGGAGPVGAAAGANASSPDRGHIGGPRGNRVLPADFPLDQLDRRARRGTYLDILV